MDPLFLLIIFVVCVGMAVVIYGSIAKTKWGINLSAIQCPACQTVIPRVRIPTDPYEVKWGGGTCQQCGMKVDKWGRIRS